VSRYLMRLERAAPASGCGPVPDSARWRASCQFQLLDVVGSPSLIAKQPAERYGNLPMLIPVGAERHRTGVPENLAAYLDQLREGIAATLFLYRLVLSKRHGNEHERCKVGKRHNSAVQKRATAILKIGHSGRNRPAPSAARRCRQLRGLTSLAQGEVRASRSVAARSID
jgi:hypothetical protein